MSKKLFITGTGTDIGKTFVTGLIVKKLHKSGLRAGYYKAAVSGNTRGADGHLIAGDPLQVQKISGISQPLDEMCPYVYEHAYSPHLASKMEGNQVELQRVLDGLDHMMTNYDYTTVEGSGGIICPLRFDTKAIQLEDIITARQMNSILIADAGLGTINSVVLTAEYMKSRNLPLKGIIFNHFEKGNRLHEDNKYMCETMTGLPTLTCVEHNATDLAIDLETLKALYEE